MAAETFPSIDQLEYSAFVECFPASDALPMFNANVSVDRQPGGHKEMSSILADQ
jgi:hypothetical protein